MQCNHCLLGMAVSENGGSKIIHFFDQFAVMIITKQLLDNISAQAKKSSRLRMNYNLHDSLESKVQRLFNALEPGTIIPVQRHCNTAETLVLVRGRLKVDIYDDSRNVIESSVLSVDEENYGVHIPIGVWHTVESLEEGTIVFEVKEGPYAPLTDEDIMRF